MNDAEFQNLLAALLEGGENFPDFDPAALNPEQQRELFEFLASEPDLREVFSRPGAFSAGVMETWFCEDADNRRSFRERILGHHSRWAAGRRRLVKGVPWALAAVLALLLAAATLLRPVPPAPPAPAAHIVPHEETVVEAPVAVLVAGNGAEFAPGHGPIGVRCMAGSYRLLAGVIHLRFLNGVDLAIKGPAEFAIHDTFYIDLHQGICRAVVPESGQGFTIETEDYKVIDLGTEFGLSVDRDDRVTELRVFQGEVDWVRRADGERRRLIHDEGVRGTADGEISDPQLDASAFPRPESIGFAKWGTWRDVIKGDPDLIAYLPMQETPGAPEVVGAADRVPTARLNGARWVAGRWPGKDALLFDRDDDWVELDLDGPHEELTIAMWMKCDRLDHRFSALMNSNGWDKGAIHLQINKYRSRLHGSIRQANSDAALRSYTPMDVETGRWHHVAYVLSKVTGKHRVYLNGIPGDSVAIPPDTPIMPGRVRIGSWQWKEGLIKKHRERAFRGRIDEVIVLRRALDVREIKGMVSRGRPSMLWPDE